MKIGRTVPPAAAPIALNDLWHGALGIVFPERSIRRLEEQLRRHFGVRHVFLVSSGTAALTLTLKALKTLSRSSALSSSASSGRNEVVIPAYTCFSVPAAVLKAGLRPVLCDINPATFDFDHALLERTLNANTLCVVAHHLFGIPSDIERIRVLCRARDIFVVEDAAQAMGVESNGRSLGTLGDAGIFSLGRGKQITCGSGGVIATNSDPIADAVGRAYRELVATGLGETLREFVLIVLMAVFIRPRLYWLPAALPFLRLGQTIFPKDVALRRFSGMKAGILHEWRARLSASNRIRSSAAADFGRRLSIGVASGLPHPYLRLPIFAATQAERARIYFRSQREGLGLSVAYPTPINEIPEICVAFNGQRFPSARRVADHLLTIPLHQWLSETDKQAIADCVARSGRTSHASVEQRKAS
jgi:dTDP-4-amino-4,6-dideoxygalactose transaminase